MLNRCSKILFCLIILSKFFLKNTYCMLELSESTEHAENTDTRRFKIFMSSLPQEIKEKILYIDAPLELLLKVAQISKYYNKLTKLKIERLKFKHKQDKKEFRIAWNGNISKPKD